MKEGGLWAMLVIRDGLYYLPEADPRVASFNANEPIALE
jgi:hypothetical protein